MAVSAGTIEAVMSLRDEMSGKLGTISSSLDDFANKASTTGGLIGMAFAAATAAVVGMTAAVVALGEHGSVVDELATSLDHFAGSTANADAILAKMRTGVAGTVDDFALMQTASKVLSAGINLTSDQFGTLTEGARVLAHQFGGDTTDMLNQLTMAMETGRMRGEALKSLHVDLKTAEEQYAASIGLTRAQLDPYLKAQADSAAILQAITQRNQEAGAMSLTFAERIEQVRAAIANWVDDLARAVATSPDVLNAMSAIGDAITTAFGGDQETLFDLFLSGVNAVARGVADAAPYIVTFGAAIHDAIAWLEAHAETIKTVGEALAAMAITWGVVSAAVALVPAALALVSAAWTTLMSVATASTVAEAAAGAGFTAMLGPIGVVTTAIGLMVVAFKEASANTGWVRSLSDDYEYAALRVQGLSADQASAQIATEHATQAQNDLGAATKNAGYITGVTIDDWSKVPMVVDAATNSISAETQAHIDNAKKIAADALAAKNAAGDKMDAAKAAADAYLASMTEMVDATESGYQKELDLAQAQLAQKELIIAAEKGDDAKRIADTAAAEQAYADKVASIRQASSQALVGIENSMQQSIGAMEDAMNQKTVSGTIATYEAQTVAKSAAIQKQFGNTADGAAAEFDLAVTTAAKITTARVTAAQNTQQQLDAIAGQIQASEVSLYETGTQKELDLNAIAEQAAEEKLQLKLSYLLQEQAAGQKVDQDEIAQTQQTLDAMNALYAEKAKAIILNNDPIFKAWQGLNANLQQTWADTWTKALSTGKGFVDAILSPFNQLEQAWLKLLGALVADWENQFIQKLTGLNLGAGQNGGLLGSLGGLLGGGSGGPSQGFLNGAPGLGSDAAGVVEGATMPSGGGGLLSGLMSSLGGVGSIGATVVTGAMTMGISAGIPIVTNLIAGLFQKTQWDKNFEAMDASVQKAEAGLITTYGSLDALKGMAGDTGTALYDAFQEKGTQAILDQTDALKNFNSVMDQTSAAVSEYGLNWTNLDNAHLPDAIGKQLDGLKSKGDLLVSQGYDYNSVITAQAKDYNDVMNAAIKSNTSIDASYLPMFQTLSDLGLLVDSQGDHYSVMAKDGVLAFTDITQAAKDAGTAAKQSAADAQAAWQQAANAFAAASGWNPNSGGGAGTSANKDTSDILKGMTPQDAENTYLNVIAYNPTDPSTDQDWNRVKSQYGFAMGGVVPLLYAAVGAMPTMGTDTVHAVLTPGEGVVTTTGMKSLGEDRLASLNRGVGMSSDTAELRAEIASLRQEIGSLLRDQPRAIARAVTDAMI